MYPPFGISNNSIYCLRTVPLLCSTSKREVMMASLNCHYLKKKSQWTTISKTQTFIGIKTVFCLTKGYLILGVLICLNVINIV